MLPSSRVLSRTGKLETLLSVGASALFLSLFFCPPFPPPFLGVLLPLPLLLFVASNATGTGKPEERFLERAGVDETFAREVKLRSCWSFVRLFVFGVLQSAFHNHGREGR